MPRCQMLGRCGLVGQAGRQGSWGVVERYCPRVLVPTAVVMAVVLWLARRRQQLKEGRLQQCGQGTRWDGRRAGLSSQQVRSGPGG